MAWRPSIGGQELMAAWHQPRTTRLAAARVSPPGHWRWRRTEPGTWMATLPNRPKLSILFTDMAQIHGNSLTGNITRKALLHIH